MNTLFNQVWQLNVELSVLILLILMLRKVAHKTASNASTYVLWLSIPACTLVVLVLSWLNVPTPLPVIFKYDGLSIDAIAANLNTYDWTYGWAWSLAGGVWLSLAVALLLRLAFQHLTLHLKLRNDLADYQSYDHSKFNFNDSTVIIKDPSFSPAVYGFFTPRIYLPKHLITQLSDEQLALIVEHEKVHIDQKHLWLNLLWDIAVCVFWFNPIFNFARNRFRYDQEVHCDSVVLQGKNSTSREAYGLALISTAPRQSPSNLMCSWQSFNQLEKRIMNIKNSSYQRGKTALLGCIIALSGIAIVYAADSEHEVIQYLDYSQARVTLGISVDPYQHMDPESDTYIDFSTVKNCAYQRNDGAERVSRLVDRSACRIVEDDKERRMTENELDTYLAVLRKVDIQHQKSPVILDTNVSGFDESTLIADLKNKGIPDDSVDEIVMDIKSKLDELDNNIKLEVRSHQQSVTH